MNLSNQASSPSRHDDLCLAGSSPRLTRQFSEYQFGNQQFVNQRRRQRISRRQRNSRQRNSRQGISLFEVLISMLVASIGVFGVLVLIPFAVKVAERGLDQESAITHARNFFSDFEAQGYRNYGNWQDADEIMLPNTVLNPGNVAIDPNQVYVIDPLGVARAYDISLAMPPGAEFPVFNAFPFATDAASDLFPDELNIRKISLRNISGLSPPDANAVLNRTMQLPQARRLFSAPDDLNFDDSPNSDIVGPAQKYIRDGASVPVKRQYDGSISSMMFTLPDPNVNGQWIVYTLIFKNRDYNPNDFVPAVYDPGNAIPNPAPAGQARVFEVQSPLPQYNNVGVVGYGGGDVILDELTNKPLEDDEVRRGDWMMLVNGEFDTVAPVTQQIRNLNFYRVIDVSEQDFRVTLQGPDFTFTDDNGTSGMAEPMNPAPQDTKTYAILIPNVIAIYERTIRLELESNYNLN